MLVVMVVVAVGSRVVVFIELLRGLGVHDRVLVEHLPVRLVTC